MQDEGIISLKEATVENLQTYSHLLGKDINTILEEALALYFEQAQEILHKQGRDDDATLTNLDFDEFWDGVEI